MKTLNISISEIEFNKFKLKNQSQTFSDFIELVSMELSRQNLDKCIELAEKYGLSEMSMEDISKEVKTVRKHAKNHH
jgi:predicted CopG family antitoxin